MSLKKKIEEILLKEHYTFSQLAEYLRLSEQELAESLEQRTLEIRYFEDMSKALKVPLYNFFRAEGEEIPPPEIPYYVNKLWTGEEESPQKLKEDIRLLKEALAYKEDALKKWNK